MSNVMPNPILIVKVYQRGEYFTVFTHHPQSTECQLGVQDARSCHIYVNSD